MRAEAGGSGKWGGGGCRAVVMGESGGGGGECDRCLGDGRVEQRDSETGRQTEKSVKPVSDRRYMLQAYYTVVIHNKTKRGSALQIPGQCTTMAAHAAS